ncbi:uncharacterized protein N7483_007999 [Penicillium malachiteum]|uniref:uncharacterized protein n=1 Tax=Penicillium malachiteum TaxID=1324776 RepID=UPI0025481CB1|nr:uncharacterized protein N7483_007999 [Penicillium malachiteum]KAJ5726642.1 hypothetical protein N7483_007999 [Penicillium malachiteum]
MRSSSLVGANWVSTLLSALATGALAQISPSPSSPSQSPTLVRLCTSSDIANMNVLNCACPSDFPPLPMACKANSKACTQTCKGGSVTSIAELDVCGAGCVDANNECNGCYIWFSGLCNCLQQIQEQKQTSCISSSNLTPGQKTPPVWMINAAHDLMTTTYLIPGILQLHQIPDYWVGFNLAQNTVRKSGANAGTLAINSVTSRTEEQIHIHLCSNGNQNVRNVLNGLDPANYKALATVDLSKAMPGSAMQCRIASQKDANIDQGGDILSYLQKLDKDQGPDNCAQYHVGSGYMVDKNGFSWSCITTSGSAEKIFC